MLFMKVMVIIKKSNKNLFFTIINKFFMDFNIFWIKILFFKFYLDFIVNYTSDYYDY